jgi:hypothetical protein
VSEHRVMWEGWDHPRLPAAVRAWPQEWLSEREYLERVCAVLAPDGESACSRDCGHPGRHMHAGGWPNPGVTVAWPGTHAPVRADLEEAS